MELGRKSPGCMRSSLYSSAGAGTAPLLAGLGGPRHRLRPHRSWAHLSRHLGCLTPLRRGWSGCCCSRPGLLSGLSSPWHHRDARAPFPPAG